MGQRKWQRCPRKGEREKGDSIKSQEVHGDTGERDKSIVSSAIETMIQEKRPGMQRLGGR